MKNKKDTEPINYNLDIQRLYLEMFLADAEVFMRCQNIFNSLNFDRRLQPVAEFVSQYVDQYHAMPEVRQVNAACGTTLDAITVTEQQTEWLMNEFENFSRHRGLERAIISSADLLEQGDYGPVERLIREAIQISLNRDLGTDYFADPRARLEKLKNNNGQVSTGWPTVDAKLYGGFNRGELNIFAAPSGGGKSLFLANLAANWALAGLDVIYFTFELSEPLVGMRLDSMLTGIPSREVFRNVDDVELRVRMLGRRSGAIRIKYLPSGKNVNDLRAYIREYQVKTQRRPDAILIDYLDLMMPVSVKVSPSDLFVKDKYVSEELRNLAMELQTLTATASQLNRAAVEEIEYDHSHIAGGLSKIQTADNVIGIFTSRAMKERGKYQIQFMKTRNSSGVGQKVDLDFNPDTLRISDAGESTEPEPTVKQLYTGLKRTAQVEEKTDPETGEITARETKPTKNVKMVSDIRNLLANLNQERD